MTFLSMLALLLATMPQSPVAPIENIVATYPRTDVVCATTTSTGRYALVAQGGLIEMLDLDNAHGLVGTVLFDATMGADATVRSMHLDGDELYIAGGTFGVLHASVPSTYSISTPFAVYAQSIDDTEYPPNAIGANDNWLECLDVIVQHGATPRLLALFSGQHGSQLRIYSLSAGVPALLSVFPLPIDSLTSQLTQQAFQMVQDPVNSEFVYVAMGTGGVIRVNTTVPTAVTYRRGPRFGLDSASPSTRTTSVTAQGHYLYVAIDKFGIAELDIGNSSTWSLATPYYYRRLLFAPTTTVAYKISSAADTHGNILLAVTSNCDSGSPVDSLPLFFHFQPGCPPPAAQVGCSGLSYIDVFARPAAATPTPPTSPTELAVVNSDCPSPTVMSTLSHVAELRANGSPGGVMLRFDQVSGVTDRFRLSRWYPFDNKGFRFTEFDTPFQGTSAITCVTIPDASQYAPVGAVAPIDCQVPANDPDLIIDMTEAQSANGAGWLRIVSSMGSTSIDKVDIINTVTMMPPAPPSSCGPPSGTGGGSGPYGASHVDGANWSNGNQQFFFAGEAPGNIRWPRLSTNCADPDVIQPDPCQYTYYTTTDMWQSVTHRTHGWRLEQFDNGNFMPPNSPLWWQLQSPIDSNSLDSEQERRRGTRYWTSLFDQRTGVDDMIYCLRSDVPKGLVAISKTELLNYIDALTSTCPGSRGRGQVLSLDRLLQTHQLSHAAQWTHYEWLDTAGCLPGQCPCAGLPCNATGYVPNHQGDMQTIRGSVASVHGPNGTRRVLAIAAGCAIRSCPNPSHPLTASWINYFNKGMVDFYDVTDVPSSTPINMPVPLGFGFLVDSSDPGLTSFACAVRILNLGEGEQLKSYAFVGDLDGRAWVFDLSKVFGLTGAPDDPAAHLDPIAGMTWPPIGMPEEGTINEWDGSQNRVLDLEAEVASADMAYVYLANGQGGFTVLTYGGFNDPLAPPYLANVSRHDTPGDCRGLEFRTTASGNKTLVVSDYLGGLRLYGR